MRELKIMFNQTKGLLQFLPPTEDWWVSLQLFYENVQYWTDGEAKDYSREQNE